MELLEVIQVLPSIWVYHTNGDCDSAILRFLLEASNDSKELSSFHKYQVAHICLWGIEKGRLDSSFQSQENTKSIEATKIHEEIHEQRQDFATLWAIVF